MLEPSASPTCDMSVHLEAPKEESGPVWRQRREDLTRLPTQGTRPMGTWLAAFFPGPALFQGLERNPPGIQHCSCTWCPGRGRGGCLLRELLQQPRPFPLWALTLLFKRDIVVSIALNDLYALFHCTLAYSEMLSDSPKEAKSRHPLPNPKPSSKSPHMAQTPSRVPTHHPYPALPSIPF